MRLAIPASASLALLLASCAVPQPKAPPAPPPAPKPAPAPAPAPQDWRDWPVSPGDWAYRQDARGSIALFGLPGGAAALTVRCDTALKQVIMARAGSLASGSAQMTIRTTGGTLQWPAQNVAGNPSYVAAARGASDIGLDQIASSRGHFTVELPGLPPLMVPAWAEFTRVVEDCRG